MKKFILYSILLLTISTACANYVFTPQGNPAKLEDFVQDGLYKLGGDGYQNNINPDSRRVALKLTVSNIKKWCSKHNGCYNGACVSEEIQATLINLTEEHIELTCKKNGISNFESQKIATQVRKDLENKLLANKNSYNKFGLTNGYFNNYFGNNKIYEIQRAQEKLLNNVADYPQSATLENYDEGFAWGALIGGIVGWAFGSIQNQPEVIVEHYHSNPPTPSAPLQEVFQDNIEPTFFQKNQESHCPFCLENFGEYNDEGTLVQRVFLPCHHAHCQDCTQDLYTGKPNPEPCTICRQRPTKQSLIAVDRAMTSTSYCCSCGMHNTNMDKVGNCAHKLCKSCTKGWKKTDKSNYCPKCDNPTYH